MRLLVKCAYTRTDNADVLEEANVTSTLVARATDSTRNRARKLVEGLPDSLAGGAVTLDCSGLRLETPSFITELVKLVLVERNAEVLQLVGAADQVARFAMEAAAQQGVPDRLVLR